MLISTHVIIFINCGQFVFSNVTQVSLSELVDPIDYEDFLQQHANLINRDPMRHILDFPPSDVQMKTIERKIRTTEPVIPKENL